jgi:hypothetical protein
MNIDEYNEFQYNEDLYINDFINYVKSTYNQHYILTKPYITQEGMKSQQAWDVICASGHGLGKGIGDAIKYILRFGKKDGYNKIDLFKAMHYMILVMDGLDRETIKIDNLITTSE